MDGDCGAFQKSQMWTASVAALLDTGLETRGRGPGLPGFTATRGGFLHGRKVSEMLITRMNHHPKCLWLYKEEMVKNDFVGWFTRSSTISIVFILMYTT